MIGRLAGRIDYRADDHILIDVRGVGYIVYCSERTMLALPSIGEFVALYTDLLVREDNLQLFGFTSLVEKEWHRLLMSVQGVGAKASLAILGALGPDGVSRAIALGDWNSVKAAKGIGPKTAQRVVNELKDKAPTVMSMSGMEASLHENDFVDVDDISLINAGQQEHSAKGNSSGENLTMHKKQHSASLPHSVQSEALSALQNLGYTPADAARAVAQAVEDAGVAQDKLDTSALIKIALKLLAPKN